MTLPPLEVPTCGGPLLLGAAFGFGFFMVLEGVWVLSVAFKLRYLEALTEQQARELDALRASRRD